MSDTAIVNPSAPAEATSSAPASPVATPQEPLAPQAATQPGTPAGATPGPEGQSPQQGWVPSYRIREAREAAVRQAQESFQQREAALRAEAERYKQQLHSIVGVAPPADPETEAIKQQFNKLFPGLSKLEQRAQDLLGVVDRAGDMDTQQQHYWQTYGRQTMDRLFSLASESLGGTLTDEAKRNLHSSFIGFIQSSPEMADRYAQDPSIVEEFWNAFSSSFIDPVRRATTVGAVQRATGAGVLPRDTSAGIPSPAAPPKPKGLDERAAMAWTQFNLEKQR